MPFKTTTLKLTTTKPVEIFNLTAQARQFAEHSGIKNGLLMVSTSHTTMAIKVNEHCENLLQDIPTFFEKLVPPQDRYLHNIHSTDGRPNAHSHLLSLLLSSQETLTVVDGKLILGEWQSIFAIELDGSRPERTIRFTLMGE